MNEKVIFYSAFNRRVGCPAPCGSAFKKKRQVKFDADGNRYLAVVGEVNFSDYINSFADEVDINKLVARCQLTGDYSLLNRAQGMFGDFTGLPSHVTEVRELVSRSDAVFNSLPAEIRSSYGTVNSFINALTSDEGVKSLSDKLNSYMEVKMNESSAC